MLHPLQAAILYTIHNQRRWGWRRRNFHLSDSGKEIERKFLAAGWVRIWGNRLRLTDAGKQALRAYHQSMGTESPV